VVKVIGEFGETRDISYTNCKIIGNGSFSVVFQTILVSEHDARDFSPNLSPTMMPEITIKKVLQDKRFLVSDNWI
jgi:glycogen synthase kinase 3 beta